MFTNEADAILIEIGRGISQTSFVGLQRNRDAVPAQEPGTPYLYNPKLGMMRYEGLPKSKEKERIGRWYRVTPDWTTFRRMITRDPFSTCMSAKVIGETKRVYCEVSKIVNENQHSFTYYTGAGMILDVTDSFLLIWHDKLGLISHFNKGLEDKFVHMQVVKFKAESKAETRHSAFHAREVKPARECRFRRLLCQSDALVKSYQAEAGKKKILYAQCPNGDRVLLLDADKHLLRKGNELGLNADEKIEVVYYKIYAGEKLVYVSGFYFQTDEEGPAKAFWDSQWERFAKTGTATDEDLPECYAESAPSECDLTDDTYREQWKKHFQFWNPDHEDIDWMSDDFTVKPFVLGRTSVTNSEVSNLTHSTATRLSMSRNPAITPSPVTVSSISTTAYVEEETVQERTEKKQDRPPKVENPFDFLVQPPEKQPVEKKKPRLATPKEKDPLEIAETVEFEEDLEEKEPVQMEPERHPFNFVRKKLWQKMSEETRTALMKKAISEAKAQTWKRMAEAEVCILRGRSDSVQFSDVSQASNCSNTSVTNSAGPSSRSSSTVPEPAEKLLELPKTVSLPKTGPLPSISPVLDGDSFNKHPKSLRLTAKNPSESIEAYLKRQMTIIDTDDSISVRNVLNKIVSTDRIMKMIAKDDPALNAILLQMYLYPDYVYIGHLALLDERYSQRESSGTAHLDRLNMERDILQYICNSTAIWEEISRIAPYCLSTIGPIQMYIFVD